MLIGTQICNTKIEQYLSKGSRVNFPYVTDVRVQNYAQGTNLTADPSNATQSYIDIDQSKAVVYVMDPVQERQAAADYGVKLAYQAGYNLKNNIDQKIIYQGVSNASSLNTVAGGTLSSSNILTKMTDVMAALAAQNATDGEMFMVVDPRREALLTQAFYEKGFQQSDRTLANGFAGKAVGFDVYVSNNLWNQVTLTAPTIPTAGGSMTIAGITFNFVAAASAAAAGDISIGANIAATKANILLMLAGTATGTAATYIDVSVENRRKMQNMQLAALEAWGATTADMLTIGAFGAMTPTEAVAEADFVWGTETTTQLAGRKGAISLGIQMLPSLTIGQEPLQLAKNYMLHTLFGAGVFYKDTFRLSKLSCNY